MFAFQCSEICLVSAEGLGLKHLHKGMDDIIQVARQKVTETQPRKESNKKNNVISTPGMIPKYCLICMLLSHGLYLKTRFFLITVAVCVMYTISDLPTSV